MSLCKVIRSGKDRLVAKIVEEDNTAAADCVFCHRNVNDEVLYGKLYSIGNLYCHYFCVLLSCCLVQKGNDDEGLLGFLYTDIVAELERSKKHKCSYCGRGGATLGCCVAQCRKQFHLPCGAARSAVSMFYGNYKSYCEKHAPVQKLEAGVAAKAQARRAEARRGARGAIEETSNQPSDPEQLCVICCEAVDRWAHAQAFWPPCCARDAWLHRNCLQRMALSAGMHYLKCPLCNDKRRFCRAVQEQGYYVPDRDAAWELENNAFSEMYERKLKCSIAECRCPDGREFDADSGDWCIHPCLLCGASAAHSLCSHSGVRFVCGDCGRTAGEWGGLEDALDALIEQAQTQTQEQTTLSGPVMPSRMSIRRTKGKFFTPLGVSGVSGASDADKTSNTNSSRQELNLKPPRKQQQQINNKNLIKQQDVKQSPMKLLESELEKMADANVAIDARSLIEGLRLKLTKPQPLSVKRRIVNGILDDIFNTKTQSPKKSKEPIKEWNSPKKIECEKTEKLIEQKSVKTKIKKKSLTLKKSPKSKRNIKKPKVNPLPALVEENNDKMTNENCIDTNTDCNQVESSIEDKIDSTVKQMKCKTVDIEKDSSFEISENDETIKIDLVKIEASDTNIMEDIIKTPEQKLCVKFSPLNKELQENVNVVDIESFKNQYLNEVEGKAEKESQCPFNHKHGEIEETKSKLQTAIDFAIEATKKKKKSKKSKKHKADKNATIDLSVKRKKNKNKIKLVYFDKNMSKAERRKLKKKKKNESMSMDDLEVNIKWREEQLNLKITKNRKRTYSETKPLKQTVLNFSPEGANNNELIKSPETDVTPKKRKYVKQERTQDNMKQMSIQSFFKTKPIS